MKPTTTQELHEAIAMRIKRHGLACDLNDIDVSGIADFSGLFHTYTALKGFCGDISHWDMSSAKNLSRMFQDSHFNGDISQWNLGKAETFDGMFMGSKFTGDISQWNVSNAKSMSRMFKKAAFNGNIAAWRVRGVSNFVCMFDGSAFAQDVSDWRVMPGADFRYMFRGTPATADFSQWSLSPFSQGRHMFSPDFTGVLPILDAECPTHLYSEFLGDGDALRAYLDRTPFNPVHADLLLRGHPGGIWASQDMMEHASALRGVGDALGHHRELRQALVDWVHSKGVSAHNSTQIPLPTGIEILA